MIELTQKELMLIGQVNQKNAIFVKLLFLDKGLFFNQMFEIMY